MVGTWAESFQTPLKTIIAGVSQNAVSNDTYFEMLELAQFKGISISWLIRPIIQLIYKSYAAETVCVLSGNSLIKNCVCFFGYCSL